MDAVIDSINILLCGGYEVGKTTLLSRLAGFSVVPFRREYSASDGVHQAIFEFPLTNAMNMRVIIYDLSAETLLSPISMPRPLVKLLDRCDGVIVVTDPLRKACATWTDITLDILQRNSSRSIPYYLVVNKCDAPAADHVVAPRQLDKFVAHSDQLLEWFYCVGHPALIDLDFSRGHSLKQKPIEDVIRKMMMLIIGKRQISIHKLLKIPIEMCLFSWKKMDLEDIADMP